MSAYWRRPEVIGTRSDAIDPKRTPRLFYLEMASGVQELLCSERSAPLAPQEFVHAACSGRAKILYEMASHDCGKRFSQFAFDNRSRRHFSLAGWLKALPGTRPGVPVAQHSGGCFRGFQI